MLDCIHRALQPPTLEHLLDPRATPQTQTTMQTCEQVPSSIQACQPSVYPLQMPDAIVAFALVQFDVYCPFETRTQQRHAGNTIQALQSSVLCLHAYMVGRHVKHRGTNSHVRVPQFACSSQKT